MIFLDEIKPLKLYNKPFYLPINLKNKKNNSVVFLLGKNLDDGQGNITLSTTNLLKNPLLNKKYFESYYIEKDVTFYINNEGFLMIDKMTKVFNEDSLDRIGTVFGTPSALSMRHYKNNGIDDDPNIDKDNNGEPPLNPEVGFNPDDTKDNKTKPFVSPDFKYDDTGEIGDDVRKDQLQFLDPTVSRFVYNGDIDDPINDEKKVDNSDTDPEDHKLPSERRTSRWMGDFNDYTESVHPLAKFLHNTGNEIVLKAKDKGINVWEEINKNKEELFFELYFKPYKDEYQSPRSRLSLSRFSSSKIISDNKNGNFKHIRFGNDYDCRGFYDGKGLVGYVNVNKKNHSIQALEITPKYQGHGLGSQLLRYSINTLHATNLSVNKNNKVAFDLYKKNGFETYDENKYMWFMKLRGSNVIKEQVITEASTYEILDSFMNMIKQAQIDEYNRQCKERVLKNSLMLENGMEEGNLEQELIPDEFIGKVSDNNHPEEFFEITNESGSVIIGFQDEMRVVEESGDKYKSKLHSLLYNDRYKTPTEVLNQYDIIKKENQNIKNTFLNLDKYKGKNLLVDLSFYNTAFLKNNTNSGDKAIDLYFHFINRLLLDKRLNNYTKKTVIIPLDDQIKTKNDLKYNISLNFVSMLIRLTTRLFPDGLQGYKDIDFIILANHGYMRFEPAKIDKENVQSFERLLIKLINKEPILDDTNTQDSKQAIVANIADKIETSQGIKIHDISGKSGNKTIDAVINRVADTASKSTSEDEALEKLNDSDNIGIGQQNKMSDNVDDKNPTDSETEDNKLEVPQPDYNHDNVDFKTLLIRAAEANSEVKISASRQARLDTVHDQFMNVKIKNKTVKELLESDNKYEKELPSISVAHKIDTVNQEEWSNLKFVTFNEVYDPNEDIVAILNSLSKKKNPIVIRDIQIDDTSTSEDFIETWTCKMEDSQGQRFTFVFDLPKFQDRKFMFLRGNRKKISGQYALIPLSKTDLDTAQIVSNYKKIFIRRFGLSAPGKSYPTADLIIKTISKNEFKDLKISTGDNTKICNKYDLPMDYIDLASVYSKLETKDYIIYFNQDEIRSKYKDKINNTSNTVPFMVKKSDDSIIYWNGPVPISNQISGRLEQDVKGYKEAFDTQKTSTKYYYSQASILAAKIPLIVVLGYNEGLTKVLDKSKIEYDMQQKKPNIDNVYQDYIKFKDGYLSYTLSYESSLLMNGLKECNTEDYSLAEVDNAPMWLDFLDIFGGRILADGLDNFYELMLDPMTMDVLERYNLPTDYVSLCLLANKLLTDNKYITHTNPESNRYRSNELLAGYAYQCIATAYGDYKTNIKKGRTQPMSMKRTAIIDAVLLDPTCSDKSILNEIMNWEDECAFSYKGLSGMNNDRSYSLDKRTYNKDMINLIAMSTGFAGNVGVNRQCTIDSNVQGKRGYLKIDTDKNSYSITKTFCPTEVLNPYSTTSDDPFRSAMNFIQTGSHSMRVKKGLPNLITNGADQAMPYFTSNVFSYKAKDDGEVVELNDSHIILKYKDGSHEFVPLEEKVEKNSNGGIFVTIKLDPCVKLGQKIKARDIVAYDKLSYSDKVGDGSSLAYSGYVLCKSVIQNSEEGYEDSTIISEWLSDAMASDVVLKKEIIIPKNSHILSMVKKGQPIKEGDSLLVFQNAYDQEDVNLLLKNLSDTEENISELGRIPIKSSVEGIVQDIKIYRTVEVDEMSESMQKIVKDYENPIKDTRRLLEKYGIPNQGLLNADYKLESTGKLKNVDDGILVEIYLKYEDKMSVGDKLVVNGGLKGVCKGVYPLGLEPHSEFRPNEKIHVLTSWGGVSARMITSIMRVGLINKGLIELDRKIKDICNIKWKTLDEIV